MGSVLLEDWPDEAERRNPKYEVLPTIDSLVVNYGYRLHQGMPVLTLRTYWHPGEDAFFQGRRRKMDRVSGEIRIVALELRAGVYVDGEKAADLSIVVDSMDLIPYPDVAEIHLPGLTWENVFLNTGPEEARAIFASSFSLRDLEIASAGFAFLGDGEEEIGGWRRPSSVSVYRGQGIADVIFDLYWLVGLDGHGKAIFPGSSKRTVNGRGQPDRSRGRSGRDRDGNQSARDAGDEQSDSSQEDVDSKKEDGNGRPRAAGISLPSTDDDDDDDDSELVPYAVAAVAAAALIGVAGGTLGYYGSSRHAPLGLTSGIVRRDGGVLLQVGVNEALLFGEPRPKKLLVKLLIFGNFFKSGIQPALGGGVLATSENGTLSYEPSVSIGAVGQYRLMLFYGGYDFWQQGPEFSVALNFRGLMRQRSNSE
ncbi:MAG: hypothetical protein WD275_08535 [Rhodothermales bacterium]